MRRADDFYETPAWATEAIVPHLPMAGAVLEPAAGEGAICRVLLRAGVPASKLVAVEFDSERAKRGPVVARCEDFLASRYGLFDLVITNPPFRAAQRFVEHALEVAGEGGTVAMLLRLSFLEARERSRLHRERPSDLFVLPIRPSFTGDGRVDASGYGWFVWGPGRGGRWQVLEVSKPRKAKSRAGSEQEAGT